MTKVPEPLAKVPVTEAPPLTVTAVLNVVEADCPKTDLADSMSNSKTSSKIAVWKKVLFFKSISIIVLLLV